MQAQASNPDVEIRRLSNELEHRIREINSDHISEVIGEVNRESFIQVAQTVSRIRASYLKQVMQLGQHSGTGKVDADAFARLRSHRIAYEEALEGFNALYHALQRGYLSLSG